MIDRKAKKIIAYNKRTMQENEVKYNGLERRDLLARKKRHKKLKT